MEDKVLMICCTKNRPDRIQEMIKSYNQTKGSDNTDIIYCLDKEDKRLAEYTPILKGNKIITEHPNYQTPMFNLISKKLYPDYNYYGLVNDDHIFRTKDWDIELVNTVKEKGGGFGIAHANCLWYDSDVLCRHPSCFVYSNKIIKALEYAIYPDLQHYKIDTYLRDLTEPLGLLFYREDVIVEHMHYHVGKAENDENYEWGYCAEEQAWGGKHFGLWSVLWAERDRDRIKKAMLKEAEKKGENNGI